jgi:hypothetical protein
VLPQFVFFNFVRGFKRRLLCAESRRQQQQYSQ